MTVVKHSLVTLGVILFVVWSVLCISMVSVPGTLADVARYMKTGEASGEGLMALPYVLAGRDDLRGEFVLGVVMLIVGGCEWVLLGMLLARSIFPLVLRGSPE